MRKKTVAIAPEVEAVLRAAEIEGNVLRLTGQLDRKLYEATNKVLAALGGKWNRGQKGHVFASDPRQVLADALDAGEALDKKKTFEQFFTPQDLAERLAELARPQSDDVVLEPSAGDGALIRPLIGKVKAIIAVDIDEANCAKLEAIEGGPTVVASGDFLTMTLRGYPRPTLVIMNPPFANGADVEHVRHAYELMAPGGRLVAIMAPHAFFASDRRSVEFREWFHANISAVLEDVPAGAFAASGTQVATKIIALRKPALAKEAA